MSVATRRSNATGRSDGPLYNGDRRTQAEFHRLYESAPDDARFELVEAWFTWLRRCAASTPCITQT